MKHGITQEKIEHLHEFLERLLEAVAGGRDFHVDRKTNEGEWDRIKYFHNYGFMLGQEYRVVHEPVTGWMNVYPDGRPCGVYQTQAEADDNAAASRIRCVRIMEDGQ